MQTKPLLNTHVFGQSVYNWLPLPSEVGQLTELPLPPTDGLSEVLVYINAISTESDTGLHHYAVFTKALEGGPIPFYYLFTAGGSTKGTCTVNSDNFWLRLPDKGLPRVVYVQKMMGDAQPLSENFKSGIAMLAIR